MSMLSGNATNLYCPGCAPGDFPQPHICTRAGLTTGRCYLCGLVWTGSHTCPTVWPSRIEAEPVPPIVSPTLTPACDHCFCLKQKAGWHDISNLKPPYPGFPQQTDRHHLKPHLICCNCGNRQVKG